MSNGGIYKLKGYPKPKKNCIIKGTPTWTRIITRIDKKIIELEREKKELLNCIKREQNKEAKAGQ